MKVTALAPWFGSNRMLGQHVGRLLKECKWVGVPFAGGMSELAHIGARTMLVGDKHRHVINLAQVVACPEGHVRLREQLDSTIFHPDVLVAAQDRCRARETADPGPCRESVAEGGSLSWAFDFFICAWMARNSTAGTKTEFNAGPSVRWEAGGGDSVVRFRNATESLADWHKVMRRCTFVTDDVFDFLDKVKDQTGHGLYLDPPFPGPGDKYKHTFGEVVHRRLAEQLTEFKVCRVVCRFYDVPLVRELYPESAWEWHLLEGRKQSNDAAPEVLLVNRVGGGLFDQLEGTRHDDGR